MVIKVDNTDSYIADDDTEEVCQIFKEDTSFEDTTSRIRLETDLVVSQSDEAGPSTSGSNSLLQPIRIPKRRRSPVTVQEWVASLPIPHLLATDRYVFDKILVIVGLKISLLCKFSLKTV